MTAYRDRHTAGLYNPAKQDKESLKKATDKANKLTAARVAKATTTDKTKGL